MSQKASWWRPRGRPPQSVRAQSTVAAPAMSRSRSVPMSILRFAAPDRVPGPLQGREMPDATLQRFVDGGLTANERFELEEFLATRPDLQGRLEAYRSQVIALNAAFNAEEEPLPPGLLALSTRLSRRLATCRVIMTLSFVAIVTGLLLATELTLSAGL